MIGIGLGRKSTIQNPNSLALSCFKAFAPLRLCANFFNLPKKFAQRRKGAKAL
jgi:hypothetical protein